MGDKKRKMETSNQRQVKQKVQHDNQEENTPMMGNAPQFLPVHATLQPQGYHVSTKNVHYWRQQQPLPASPQSPYIKLYRHPPNTTYYLPSFIIYPQQPSAANLQSQRNIPEQSSETPRQENQMLQYVSDMQKRMIDLEKENEMLRQQLKDNNPASST